MAFGTDYTPVGPMPTDIVLGDVDATSMRLARDIRDKGHGIDTRETMARMILKSSTMHNHLIKVNNALKVQNDEYYRQFTDVLKELSEDKDYHSLPEIAGARRGYQTLIESMHNLSFNMFNTNLGKVTPNMVSDELLAQIAGDAAVNAVPADGSLTTHKYAHGSVTPAKTTFFDNVPSANEIENLFDINTATMGYSISIASGNEFANAQWMVSNHIPVSGSTEYVLSHTGRYVEFDADGNYVYGEADVTEFTTSLQTRTIRVTTQISSTDFKVYLKHKLILKDEYINKSVELDDFTGELDFTRFGNLYSDDIVEHNRSVGTSGVVINSDYYDLLSNIRVKSGERFTITKPRGHFVVFYDEEGNSSSYLTANAPGVEQDFVAPISGYMSVNVFKEYATDFKLFRPGGEDGFRLNELRVVRENLTDDLFDEIQSIADNNSNSGKKVDTFGDSITWYDGKTYGSSHLDSGTAVGYISYLRTALGMNVGNQGVSGNNMGQILSRIKSFTFEENQVVTITSGANDWSQQRPIGELALPGSTFVSGTFYGEVQEAVEHIINLKLDIKVVLITPIRGYHPLSTHSGEWLSMGRVVGGMLEQPDVYAKVFKDVAELYGLKVVDFRDGLGLNFLNYKELLLDNPDMTSGKYVHPGNEMHEIMGKYIVDEFRKITF